MNSVIEPDQKLKRDNGFKREMVMKQTLKRIKGKNGRHRTDMLKNNSILTLLYVSRVFCSSLPVLGVPVKKFFDFVFDIMVRVISKKKFYVGAYTIFEVTPGAMVSDSPLLGKSSTGFSFPGTSVEVKSLRIVLQNTTPLSERRGRWSMVFVPYRERTSRRDIKKNFYFMKFTELASMPYAVQGLASDDLMVKFSMKNHNDYCSRPRQMRDSIGIVMVIWDTNFNQPSAILGNQHFNCEMMMTGEVMPNTIFGASHRIEYPASMFRLRQLTTGGIARVEDDGRFTFEDYDRIYIEHQLQA